MPGLMRLFVRIEGQSPFCLILQDDLLPEHYVQNALQYYKENWHLSRAQPELVLVRRVCFRNNDVLLDFKKRAISRAIKPPTAVIDDQQAPGGAGKVSVYESTNQPEITRHEMVVTNPPMASVVSFCDTDLIIKSVTLNRLVMKITDPTCSPFVEAVFWDTYRAYTTPNEVMNKLMERYEVPGLTILGGSQRSPLDEQHFAEVTHRIRLTVVRCFEHWFERYPFDFCDDGMFHKFTRWVRQKIDKDSIPTRIVGIIRQNDRTALKDRKPPILPGVASRSLAPSAVVAQYHPREVANQLTLLTLHVHNMVHPHELLGGQWQDAESSNVPNFNLYRELINKVSNWVTYALVSEKETSVRANNLAVFLVLCDELLKLNNWDMLVAVHGGITDPPVARLTATHAALSAKALPLLEKFNELLSVRGTSKTLKSAMAASPRPHFPSIVVYLRDLLHLEETPATNEDGMIDFLKCIHQHNLVKFLLDGKWSKLEFVADPVLQGVFSHWRILDDKILAAMSLECQD